MARFDLDPDRPSLPEDDSDPILEAETKYRKLMTRRYLPRLRMPRFIRRRLENLPPEIKERWQVVSGFIQAISFLVFGCAAVALLISALSRAIIVEPKTAARVLKMVEDPKDISYNVQTVRYKTIDGATVRRDSLRAFQVDLETNKFQSLIAGLRPEEYRLVGDGKDLVLKEGRALDKQIPDYPPPEHLRPVLASDLIANADKLISNKATVAQERGWYLTWKPNREIVLRLLSADLIRSNPSFGTDPDLEAISRGDFQTLYTKATVKRNKRELYQLDTLIRVNGAEMRILATYRAFNTGGLRNLNLENALDDNDP